MDDRADLAEAEAKARELARTIKKDLPTGWGFMLILASYGADGFMTYISSCDREDAKKMLVDLFKKFEMDPRHWANVTHPTGEPMWERVRHALEGARLLCLLLMVEKAKWPMQPKKAAKKVLEAVIQAEKELQ